MAYSPSETPGLRHWWPAARSAAEGAAVPSIVDSGPGAQTVVAASTPLYRPAAFGAGRPGVEYPAEPGVEPGPCLYVGSPVMAGLSTLTVSTIATIKTGTTTIGHLWARELGIKVVMTSDQKPRLLVSSNGTSWAVNETAAAAVSLGVPHVYTVLLGGGTAKLRVDGVQVIGAAFTGTVASNGSDWSLGAIDRNGYAAWHGLIGDVVVSSQLLAGAGLTALEGYFPAASGPVGPGSGPTILRRGSGTWSRRKLNRRTAGAWVWGA